jgi:hypothetical protein
MDEDFCFRISIPQVPADLAASAHSAQPLSKAINSASESDASVVHRINWASSVDSGGKAVESDFIGGSLV